MSGAHRLPTGGLVDRARPLSFTFDGVRLKGFAGDTVASALLANGRHLVARSFKYHRPRGIFGAGPEDSAAVLQQTAPFEAANVLATTRPLVDGLQVESVNRWPSLGFDLGAAAQLAAPLLAAGFYYKTFMGPGPQAWHFYERFIRRAAGLGRAPSRPPEDLVWESRHGHCDVLVVGAGPAGLAAALAAARGGARVILADDGLSPGGRLVADGCRLDGAPAQAWIESVLTELGAMANVRVFRRATVWGFHEHGHLTMLEREPRPAGVHARSWKLRARRVVLATGAFERPIAFADNDRPGIMLASAVRAYLHRQAVLCGRRVVVFANNGSGYAAAADLARAGAGVTLLDSRARPAEAALQVAARHGVEVQAGTVIRRAHGRRHVTAVEAVTGDGAAREIGCDLVCLAGGWNPAIHLASQSREARAVWDVPRATFLAQHRSRRFALAGAAAGGFALADCLAQGAQAGADAAEACGHRRVVLDLPRADDDPPFDIAPLWAVPSPSRRAKVFVDLSGDVTTADLALARREGYESIEHVKRYTTAGMGIDQGKTGNVLVIGHIAAQAGLAPDQIGTTTFRSPYTPVEFGAIGAQRHGPRLFPWRHTPLTDWHVAAGAVMYEAGLRWQRPGYYPRAGEDLNAATQREALGVREAVGVYDGTPLGKFQLKGPDVGAFLDLVYTGVFSTLRPGEGRYGVMLTEDGLPLDDGVTFRLDEQRWLLHCSTGNAERVHQHLEQLLAVHRPDLRVTLIPVTSQWANATLCGPRAREVLRALSPDFDVSREAFAFMGLRAGRIAGLPARVMRVSYTGELSFEINVAARHAVEIWERILEAGRPYAIAPVGSEANHVLRVEAGYLSFGHEVDGTADVIDLGLGALVSRRKPDFVGRRAMEIRRRADPARRELVGLLPRDPQAVIPEGAPIVPGGTRGDSEGFLSACVASPALGRSVGLGLLMGGRARHGEIVHARAREQVFALEVVPPVFHDADRARVKS